MVLLALLAPATALADELTIGGIPLPDVTVRTIEGAQIVYLNPAGTRMTIAVDQVDALRLSAHPALGRAEDLVNAGNIREAVPALVRLRERADESWVQQWVDRRIVTVADSDHAQAAVEAYLRLFQPGVHAQLRGNPPLDAIRGAPASQRPQLAQRLRRALGDAPPGTARETIEQMLAAAGSDPPPPEELGATQRLEGAQIPLPSFADGADEVVQALAQRRFSQARDQAAELIQSQRLQLAARLYQLGVAQIYLAEQAEDPDQRHQLHLDAGLALARVVYHFPTSNYLGPSQLELGRVHHQIGRLDLAAQLYDQAEQRLDTRHEAALVRRLEQFRRQLQQDQANTDQTAPSQ